MIEKEVQELLSFIDGNPTAYHTTASVRNILLKEGFSELLESRRWQLEPGRSYFVCRNGSSILAFRMGEQLENYSFNVAAAHTDSPCFRIKENAEIHMGRKYTKLNTEGYGGMICSTWMDRPLSVAGRILIKENDAITSRLLTLDRDLLLIPMACSLFGISNDIAMQVVGVGFIIGVVQDSVETALNSAGDVEFAATAEYHQWLKEGKPLPEFLGGKK